MRTLTDIDLMPFGKYKGMKMIDVPASYLLWFLENGSDGNVKDYARDNKEALIQELNKDKK
jgi:hypothetical protein